MTFITPQIRLRPIAASPYTAPTSTPSIMEARMPDISRPPRARVTFDAILTFSRNSLSVHRIHQVGALAYQWPNNLSCQFAGFVLLPLRQNHGMAYLQAVFIGGGRILGPPVKGSDIGRVQRLRHLSRLNAARLFDGALQDQPAGVATGGL